MPLPNPSSAVAGFLPPASTPSPPYGKALEIIVQETIVGITRLGPTLVRPRWQPSPPDQPAFDVDWAAFGIMNTKKDWSPYWRHIPIDNSGYGADEMQRDEALDILFSFYGPNSMMYQSLFEDGIQVEQNRALLSAAGILWESMGDSFQLPALLKEKWVKRIDQRMQFKRRIVRRYPILNIESADITLHNELYDTDISVTPPTP